MNVNSDDYIYEAQGTYMLLLTLFVTIPIFTGWHTKKFTIEQAVLRKRLTCGQFAALRRAEEAKKKYPGDTQQGDFISLLTKFIGTDTQADGLGHTDSKGDFISVIPYFQNKESGLKIAHSNFTGKLKRAEIIIIIIIIVIIREF
jgi:hypothetical protein